jgi:hypothetical protein
MTKNKDGQEVEFLNLLGPKGYLHEAILRYHPLGHIAEAEILVSNSDDVVIDKTTYFLEDQLDGDVAFYQIKEGGGYPDERVILQEYDFLISADSIREALEKHILGFH